MTLRDTIGREPITLVEIDQDLCSLIYGVSPCQALLGVTGDAPCFNCLASCQDEDNFTLDDPLTLRFCVAMENTGLAKSIAVIPSLLSVTTVPTAINIAASDSDASPLGQRAKVTAEFRDHPYDDHLVDPYWRDRDYDAMARGTFWSKWLARNPYHQGRALRVYEGYVGQTLAEMRVRHYVIERIDGPSKGIVKVVAKDPLKLLDDNRRQIPAPNTGTLFAGITDVAGSLVLDPAGIGNEQYPASGVARIGGELVTYTRSADTITLTGRALRGTTAETHAAGDVFQEVLVVLSRRIDLLLYDLLVTYGGIEADFIPVADWDAEADLWLNGFNCSAWITEPTGIAQLTGEAIRACCCFIWWDDEDQEVKLRAVRPFYPLSDAVPIEVTQNANIIADSVEMEFKPEERITEVRIYYDQINPTAGVDDPANYNRYRVLTDDDAESARRFGDKRIKTLFARFLDDSNDAATSVLASRTLERYHETPRLIKFSTDAKDSGIRTGSVIRMTHRDLVDVNGASEPVLIQIMSHEEVEPGHRIEFSGQPYLSRTRYGFIMDNSVPDYSAATAEEQETGGWIAVDAVGFANGDLPYRIL